jgi:DNA-binding transcriptional MerR regulator
MKNESGEKYYNIGELAKSAGITIRTLQYYDKENLLNSTMNESGRRIYCREDVLRLQQILFLKSCGFSLEEINDQVLKENNSSKLVNVFENQKKIIMERIENYNKMIGLLNSVIQEIITGEEVNVDKLITIISLMQQGNPYAFVIRYFNNDQFKGVVDQLVDSPEKVEMVKEVFEQMNYLYQKGADPSSTEGQDLAKRWWIMVNEFTHGDPEILKVLLSAGKDIGNWPQEAQFIRESIENFLEKALDSYLLNNGIKIIT